MSAKTNVGNKKLARTKLILNRDKNKLSFEITLVCLMLRNVNTIVSTYPVTPIRYDPE